jgi:hypothetical protein
LCTASDRVPPAAASSESLPVQFVLRDGAIKKHATVVNNELTIGVNEPYPSSIKVGDFEATRDDFRTRRR